MAVDRGAGDDRNETTGPTGNGRRVNGWYDTAVGGTYFVE